MRRFKIVLAFWTLIILLSIAGEVKCFIKMVNCNWNPIGKAEVIYTASFFTGFGAIVGWIDIKDN